MAPNQALESGDLNKAWFIYGELQTRMKVLADSFQKLVRMDQFTWPHI